MPDDFMSNSRPHERSKTQMLLSPEYWKGQQQGDKNSEVHARSMKPLCETISIGKDIISCIQFSANTSIRSNIDGSLTKEPRSFREFQEKFQLETCLTPLSLDALSPLGNRPRTHQICRSHQRDKQNAILHPRRSCRASHCERKCSIWSTTTLKP